MGEGGGGGGGVHAGILEVVGQGADGTSGHGPFSALAARGRGPLRPPAVKPVFIGAQARRPASPAPSLGLPAIMHLRLLRSLTLPPGPYPTPHPLNPRSTQGFEIGSGFSGSRMLGSEHNDAFYMAPDGSVRTRTNRSGGVQGGISNGEDVVLRLAFKPTATITARQDTVNRSGEDIQLAARGRHDPCVVPRAVPMVEAMVALVLADALLQHYGQCELLPRSSAAGADVPSHTQFSHAG